MAKGNINKLAGEQSAIAYEKVHSAYKEGRKEADIDTQVLEASQWTGNGDDNKTAQYNFEEKGQLNRNTSGGILNGDEYTKQLESDYSPDENVKENSGGDIHVKGTQSIHNKYIVFRLAGADSYTSVNNYPSEKHYDDITGEYNGSINDKIQEISHESGITRKKFLDVHEKPTAQNIIKFANKFKELDTNQNSIDFLAIERLPYSMSDFVYCKWYGKIPNTNLITLRRFAQPVSDNGCNNYKEPQLPIAQALTYFGEETGNKLSDILKFTFGLLYEKINAEVWNVEGNEAGFGLGLESLVKSDGGMMGAFIAYARMTAKENGDEETSNAAKGYFTGTLKRESEWSKKQWTNEGAYWNQIFGPVNVINENHRRKRGMNFQNDITLKFSYCLRSIDGINPKVAMLDLIVNFLSLTYNNARFWGGLNRYFPKTDFQTEAIGDINEIAMNNWSSMSEEIDYLQKTNKGLSDLGLAPLGLLAGIFKNVGEDAKVNLDDEEVKKELTNAETKITENASKDRSFLGILNELKNNATENITNSLQAALTMFSSNIAKNRPGKLSIKSMLSGENVGEWHLVVGNPMNPIALMGNMIVENCTMQFNDTLGVDDFPTEVSFSVKLKHARPRDVADIESMLNLGCGKMSYSPLTATSSEMNTFGEAWQTASGGNSMMNVDGETNESRENLTFMSTTKNYTDGGENYKNTHRSMKDVKDKDVDQNTYETIRTKLSNEWGNSYGAKDVKALKFLLQKTKIKM